MTMKLFSNLEPKVALDQIHLRTTISWYMVFVMANDMHKILTTKHHSGMIRQAVLHGCFSPDPSVVINIQ